jgi:anti-anti-sigma factor
MEIVAQRHGEVAVLKPAGPLVADDADALAARLAEVLREGCRAVVLDASQVAFVDSRGLEVLLDATEQLSRLGQPLKLSGANDRFWEVLELTELAPLFEQFDDVDAAVGSAT